MIKKTIMLLQSSSTGKILLKKRGNVWGFTADIQWGKDQSDVFNGISEIKELIGLDDEDNMVLDYLGNIAKIGVWHCVYDGEPRPKSTNASWFSLFNFPENFDPIADRLFENDFFVSKIISPSS
jgi:hypothetical protein